jgi:hypothetical protein
MAASTTTRGASTIAPLDAKPVGSSAVQVVEGVDSERQKAQRLLARATASLHQTFSLVSRGGNQTATTVVAGTLASGFTLPCILDPQLFWWDCYTASSEGGLSWSWYNHGWSEGRGFAYSKTASPGDFAGLNLRDPYNLAMSALLILDVCDKGKRTTHVLKSNSIQWSWDKKLKRWAGPAPL